jgi:O-antigen biosynthesis protein
VGTPSVSTTVGAEGLPLSHDRGVLVADTPAEFAAALEALCLQDDLWRRIAADGRSSVSETHSPETAKERLRSVIEEVLLIKARAVRGAGV